MADKFQKSRGLVLARWLEKLQRHVLPVHRKSESNGNAESLWGTLYNY